MPKIRMAKGYRAGELGTGPPISMHCEVRVCSVFLSFLLCVAISGMENTAPGLLKRGVSYLAGRYAPCAC